MIATDKGTEFIGLGYNVLHHSQKPANYLSEFPEINAAPTGNKHFNGLAERTIGTLRIIKQLLILHLPPFSQELYLEYAFNHAAQIYNRTPHSAIGLEYPLGKYFKRKGKLYSEKDVKISAAARLLRRSYTLIFRQRRKSLIGRQKESRKSNNVSYLIKLILAPCLTRLSKKSYHCKIYSLIHFRFKFWTVKCKDIYPGQLRYYAILLFLQFQFLPI